MAMKYQPAKYHEDIVVFGKKGKVIFNPIKWKIEDSKKDKRKTINQPIYHKEIHLGTNIKGSRKADDGYRYPKSVLKINKSINGNVHPTQKPVALFEYLIKTYSNEGDLVLDNCAGSGTTGVACINTNRQFILIEKEDKYFQICKERCLKAQEQTKLSSESN